MIDLTEILILSFSSALIFLVKLLDKDPPALFGIYQRKNGFYWLKVAFMYCVLKARKIKRALSKHDELQFSSSIDRPQKLSNHDKAIDAVYMNGANKNGDHLVVGLATRPDVVDGFLYLKIAGSNLGVLETPKLPSTTLCKTKENKSYYFAEGIKMEPVEPMKKWKLSYSGKMKEFGNRAVEHNVKIEGSWESDQPYFNFDYDIDPMLMAKSMALERWSRSYFEVLEGNHQTHYEQFGTLKLDVTIDEKVFKIELETVRDHSFGKYREWGQFHRYALHYFATETGDCFAVGQLCAPITFSCLTFGYVYNAKQKKIFPLRDCSFKLFQHGGIDVPSQDYGFTFSAGGKTYAVQVQVVDSPHFYISKNWEAKIYERMCIFEVNGVKAWGASEWQYRNIQGKSVQDHESSSPE
nr:uncharacterized protein LOC111504538 [Leptinotarsa decemlineata]